MGLQIIEGTWEEIKSHEHEFVGQRFRLIPLPEPASIRQSISATNTGDKTSSKKLSGFGTYKGLIGSSEDFAREKQAEIDIEDRNL